MVDNGVLRLDEAKQVHEMLNTHLGVNLTGCGGHEGRGEGQD